MDYFVVLDTIVDEEKIRFPKNLSNILTIDQIKQLNYNSLFEIMCLSQGYADLDIITAATNLKQYSYRQKTYFVNGEKRKPNDKIFRDFKETKYNNLGILLKIKLDD